jgi:hypothetical protein
MTDLIPDIESFEVERYPLDLGDTVPKLKGQQNWREWEAQLRIGLSANNPHYIHMISGNLEEPSHPTYFDTSPETVRASLAEERTPVTTQMIRCRMKENKEENKEIQRQYNMRRAKWEECNARARMLLGATLGPEAASLVTHIASVRDAYLALEEQYAVASHQNIYIQWDKLKDLRFESGTAPEFMGRFQEAVRDFVQMMGPISPHLELCFFKDSIISNPRCHAFIQNLRVNEKDPNFMNIIFVQFIEMDIANRQWELAFSRFTAYFANSTAKRRDSSKNKKIKKKNKHRDQNDIVCQLHNAMINYFTKQGPLEKSAGSSNADLQPSQQLQPRQVSPSNPEEVIGPARNDGQFVPHQHQASQQPQQSQRLPNALLSLDI